MSTKNTVGFEWPEYRTERERIKATSLKYFNADICDAFRDYYGLTIKKPTLSKEDTSTYRDLQPGDLVWLRIKSVDKKNVFFEAENYKEEISSAVNLSQYARFKNNIPSKPVECLVISKNLNKIVVDPLQPLYNRWIKEHTSDLSLQYSLTEDRSILVTDLHPISKVYSWADNKGFVGNVNIDTVSDFVGQPICMKVFVPGSQIVQNIESDFSKWEGESIRAFISSYNDGKKGQGLIPMICSAKDYLQFLGNINIINIFKDWTEENEAWKKISVKPFEGIITGVINSAKNCGVFVEIPELHVTGMVAIQASELCKYKKGETLMVNIKGFTEPKYYNQILGTFQHRPPYIIENGILKKCSIKMNLKLAE